MELRVLQHLLNLLYHRQIKVSLPLEDRSLENLLDGIRREPEQHAHPRRKVLLDRILLASLQELKELLGVLNFVLLVKILFVLEVQDL